MMGKWSSVILFFFGLYGIIKGMTLNPQNIQQYYECWILAQCYSNGPAIQFESCIRNSLTPEDLNEVYQFIREYYAHYRSDTYDSGVIEMCNERDDMRRQTYTAEINGLLGYQRVLCNNPYTQDKCYRLTNEINCAFSLLEGLRQNNVCKISGPTKYVVLI
ncbi:uncharacterized protein LOC129962390 [Argiope bruennichi]|uniref:uncharacterized protein LOC129962390 n=1 Tax=Argiope bruennichi TaxID=94029 RepID=UPI002494F5E0|nr:uncharacterized protein LOC129962390 [Argiope bruennichi]